MSENAVMMARAKRPEIFQDDGFLPDLELDIMTTRPEYAEDWKDKLVKRLRKCDIWKVLPTLLVSNAFSISITVLTTCSFVKLTMSYETDPISFGLWSYTDPDRLPNGTIFNPHIPTQLPNQECHPYDFTLHHHSDAPEDNMGVTLDSKFRTARAFGVLTACIGFLTMAALWLGVVRDYDSTTNWRRWVGGSLLLCCFLQGMTLVVLKSGVCAFGDCHLGGGATWVIFACALWFSSGALLLKWPRAKEYTHSTLAGDEGDDGEYEYPAQVGDDDVSVLSGLWKSMGSEQIEMVKPYRDNPQDNKDGRPAAPVQSSSLRDLLSGFNSELNVSFEHASVKPTNGNTTPKPIPPPPPPPSAPLTPQDALEQLRQQSTIQATKSPPKPVAPPPVEKVDPPKPKSSVKQPADRAAVVPQAGSREELKNILNAFDDDSL
jgi:hypothetical protein